MRITETYWQIIFNKNQRVQQKEQMHDIEKLTIHLLGIAVDVPRCTNNCINMVHPCVDVWMIKCTKSHEHLLETDPVLSSYHHLYDRNYIIFHNSK